MDVQLIVMWVYLRMKCWQMKSFLTSDHHSLFCTETDDLVWGGVSSLGYRDLLQRWFSSQRLGKSRQWGKTVFNYIGLYPVSFSWMYSTKLEPVDIYIYIYEWKYVSQPAGPASEGPCAPEGTGKFQKNHGNCVLCHQNLGNSLEFTWNWFMSAGD